MKTSPSSAQNRTRIRRRLILAITLATILIAGYFIAKPALIRLKSWRSHQLATQSAEHLKEGDWTTASAKAQAALSLSPNEPIALRAMARVLTQGTNLPSVAVWQRLIQTGEATPEDRRSFVEQALRAGAGTMAAEELDKLLKESPSSAVNLWLAARLFAAAGDLKQADYFAARARLNDHTNQQYQLFLAGLRFDSTQSDQRLAAHSNMWDIARESGPFGLEALTFLARRRDLSTEQRQTVAALLRKHPTKTTAHDLLALTMEILATPDRRPEILDAAQKQYTASDPATRLQFAVWLNQNGEHRRTLETVPLVEALKRQDFFLAHADALGSLGQWDSLKKIFETSKTPLEHSHAEAFRARCEKELTNASLAELHWRQATKAAERNPEQLMWLALYADKCGEFETAKRALRSLISYVENPLPAYQVLERVTEQSGSTTELRDLLNEMAKRWPNEPAYQNDLAYLNALLNTDIPIAKEKAEALVRSRPDSLPHRTSLALARYRQRDFVGALRAYEGREFKWQIALPNQRAVYAAVLAANGRDTEARELVHGLTPAELRPEELNLVAALR